MFNCGKPAPEITLNITFLFPELIIVGLLPWEMEVEWKLMVSLHGSGCIKMSAYGLADDSKYHQSPNILKAVILSNEKASLGLLLTTDPILYPVWADLIFAAKEMYPLRAKHHPIPLKQMQRCDLDYPPLVPLTTIYQYTINKNANRWTLLIAVLVVG